MDREYYEAYDDRYRQVHAQGLRWFDEAPSGIVSQTMEDFHISKEANLLEIGCGEGRDARFLLRKGHDLLATDISPEAIDYCRREDPEHSAHYRVLDCVRGSVGRKFDLIYAVSVVHMLVKDEDRRGFYGFIREHLKPGGIALICTMGDGQMECATDATAAFAVQERIHEPTGKRVMIASTSYRAVSFAAFEQELGDSGLEILKQGFTDIQPDYWKVMYAVVKKQS